MYKTINMRLDMSDEEYFTVRLKKEPYGDKIDEYREKHPGYTSRADAVRDILRQYFKSKH